MAPVTLLRRHDLAACEAITTSPQPVPSLSPAAEATRATLEAGGALFFEDLLARLRLLPASSKRRSPSWPARASPPATVSRGWARSAPALAGVGRARCERPSARPPRPASRRRTGYRCYRSRSTRRENASSSNTATRSVSRSVMACPMKRSRPPPCPAPWKTWTRSGIRQEDRCASTSVVLCGPAVEHQRFCGDFSYSRMSWVEPTREPAARTEIAFYTTARSRPLALRCQT
jgi:hypothetical protein